MITLTITIVNMWNFVFCSNFTFPSGSGGIIDNQTALDLVMAGHQTDTETIYIGYTKLKTKSRHDANFIITGGIGVVVMITRCAVNNKVGIGIILDFQCIDSVWSQKLIIIPRWNMYWTTLKIVGVYRQMLHFNGPTIHMYVINQRHHLF